MERCAPWRGVAPSRTTIARIPRGIRIMSFASVIAFTVGGCDLLSDPQDSVLGSPVPQKVTIAVGQKQQIGATGRGNTPTWTSDDPRVVSVSTTGLASALAPGRAHVVLRLRGRMDTTLVVVHAAVRAVHMAASSTPLALGGAMGIAYRATDPAGDEIRDLQGTTISWISRNADVASVDSSGLVRSKNIGDAEIILTIDGFTDSTLVRVTAQAPPGSPVEPIPPSPQPVKPPTTPNPPPAAPATASVRVTLDSVSLVPGHASPAHAVARDARLNVLAGKTAIWSSLNPSVANVSTSGIVTALSAGTATIQGSVDGVSGTASLVVTAPPVVTAPSAPTGDLLAEPTFDGTQAKMLFDESFDGYSFNTLHPPCGAAEPAHTIVDHSWYYCKQFTTNGGPGVDNGVTVVPGHSGNAVQWHYDGVYQETHGVATTGNSAPPTGKKATVVQYWARFKGDNGTLGTSAIIQIKNIMLWHENNRFQIMLHSHFGCPVIWPLVHDAGRHRPSGNRVQLRSAHRSILGRLWTTARWHRWTVYFKPNSSPGAGDGVARLWIDGTLALRIEASAVGVTPPGGWKPWCTLDEVNALYSGTYGVGLIEWGANLTNGNGVRSRWRSTTSSGGCRSSIARLSRGGVRTDGHGRLRVPIMPGQ